MRSSPDIWNILPVPAFVVAPDANGSAQIKALNPAAEAFLDQSQAGVLGMSLGGLFDSDADLEKVVIRAREGDAPVFLTDVHIASRLRPAVACHVQVAPMGQSDGAVLITLTPREVTGRLAQGQGGRIAAKSAIGMAQMLAHEVKNPLAGITGAAQLLSMELPAKDQELTDLIVLECRRIVSLIDQVEHFGDQRPPVCKPFNLHDMLERARRSAAVGFAAHMTISDAYDPSLPMAWGDADQLSQVVLNLLRNAAEAQPEGGHINIRTVYEAGLQVDTGGGTRLALPLHIEISDDGPGLPQAIAQTVFDPFVSGRENGTGLGLALVSKVVSDHHGWIDVKRQNGRTVFRVSLPMAPAKASTPPLKESET